MDSTYLSRVNAELAAKPEPQCAPRVFSHVPETAWDAAVSRDYQRLLLLSPTRPVRQTIGVVQNWPALIGRR